MDILSHAAIFFSGFCLGAITCLVWEFKDTMKHYVQMYIEGCEPMDKKILKVKKENDKKMDKLVKEDKVRDKKMDKMKNKGC